MVLWLWVWADLVWVVESNLGRRIGSGLWVGFGSLEWFYGCGLIDLVVGCCGLLGVKSFSGVPWLIDSVIGCGFVVGGDIEWMVAGGGQEGWVVCFCLEKRETQKERERDVYE